MAHDTITRPLRSAIGLVRGLPLFFMQEQLLFPRQRLDPAQARRISAEHPSAEEVRLQVGARDSLHGWLVKSGRTATPAPLLIYFAGNADEVSGYIPRRQLLGEHALLLMNYRGYGLSVGQPSERALLDDALRIFDAMASRRDIDSGRIAVLGRSLGSGVAVHLAAERPVSGAILTTPFDSIASVAQSRYPDVPIRWLLRHHFDSISRLTSVRTPATFIVAETDDVIPIPHARKLYEAWSSSKSWHQLAGTTHADIVDHPRYWEIVAAFLHRVHAPASSI